MNNEEIIELASKHCYGKTFTWDGELKEFTFRLNNIEAFYHAAFNHGIEAAAKVCESSDRYRGDYFASKVRALKEQS